MLEFWISGTAKGWSMSITVVVTIAKLFLFFQVLLAECTIHSGKCDKTCAEVEIEEHTECGCECKMKRHHCNAKQVRNEFKSYLRVVVVMKM
jgi:hypothetical protein